MEDYELLEKMNELLCKGMKVSEAEKQLGFSDGQCRKKLSKLGFKFERKGNKYIPKDEMVTPLPHVTTLRKIQKNPMVTGSDSVTVMQSKDNQKPDSKPVFTDKQVDILYQIIKEYETRAQIQTASHEDKGKTINRNVRVYEKQFEAFANWCKTNNVTQADALHRAIEWIMNNK